MTTGLILLATLILAAAGYVLARARALATVDGNLSALHSLPGHYGWFAASLAAIPALLVLAAWMLFGSQFVDSMVIESIPQQMQPQSATDRQLLLNDIHNAAFDGADATASPAITEAAEVYSAYMATGRLITLLVASVLAGAAGLFAVTRVKPHFRARNALERLVLIILVFCSGVAILTTIGIVLSLLFESLRFFREVPLLEFLTGLNWSPQTALRADQVAAAGSFGAVPLFTGTLLVSLVAMLVAVPIGLMSAVYLTQYASQRTREFVKPILEVLAGVPTVVYGFFAVLQVAPLIRDVGQSIGLSVASESALAAGSVMGIMIIPFMSSLSDDAISAVPASMRDGAYALGATKSETIINVLIPAALPGIVGAFLLSVSRAIGETMIVVMAAGVAAKLTANPLESVTTVTVQIVSLLTGDQEFDSAKTLSAFALGLVLFAVTLVLNIVALYVTRKYRETYE